MILEKPPFFASRREFLLVMTFLLTLFLLRLFLLHAEYREFTVKPFFYTNATVLKQYKKSKRGKSYEVLKLKSEDGKVFYTTLRHSRDLTGKMVRVKMLPDSSISFADYLGRFYIKTILRVVGEGEKERSEKVEEWIASQHQDPEVQAFYQAIFVATPVPRVLREKISGLGVSHLVALSGFHLTILWGLVYGILSLFYRALQQRFFPFRSMLLDLGAVTLVILGCYLWFVGYPPSLLRSYTMLLIAWMIVLWGIELLSFQFLGFVSMLLLVIFPTLSVSLGFWFSVIGVFYIYLVLYWSQRSGGWMSHRWVIALFSIPVGIFVLMLPVAHTVFGLTCRYQLLSPLLSLLFIPFYPLSISLHLLGIGNLFDKSLLQLFALPAGCHHSILPVWSATVYALISIASMWSRSFFVATVTSALLYLFYLFVFV